MKKKINKLMLLGMCMMLMPASSFAQDSKLSLGLTGGLTTNQAVINKGYAADYKYSNELGATAGIVGRYQFVDWFALRADLRMASRNYKMSRGMSTEAPTVNTKHTNLYLQLPVVADFSFGSKKLRGHFYAGGYAGYWLNAHRSGDALKLEVGNDSDDIALSSFDEKMDFDSRRDNRFNAGLTCGAGISYRCDSHWEIMGETFYQYDLTSSTKSGVVSIPRYNNTLSFSVGIMYNF